MNVFVLKRAAGFIERTEAWWKANRDKAPDVFRVELRDALKMLSASPKAGAVYRQTKTKTYRRWLLPKSQQHIYYVVDERRDRLVVHVVWGAARGRPPALR